MSNAAPIEPETKVATLLAQYPELEDVLIGMAPPFEKLRNPLLRKSVARVASLRQAAAVARMPVHELVDRLRSAVGQPRLGASGTQVEVYFTERPAWFDAARVVDTFVEDELDPDVMPLAPLLQRATKLQAQQILELVTTYLPAPGIDIMQQKGFRTWSTNEGKLVTTYFCKPD